MRIIAISDLHGDLIDIEEQFDLLLICGDVCPTHDHYYSYQINWVQHDFAQWINNLPFKDENSKVVMTWGNHDFVGERIGKAELDCLKITTNSRLIVLNNEGYTFEYPTNNENGVEVFKTLRIFGCPYCKVFGNWAFMRENLDKYYEAIPTGLDVLITHDAADIEGLGLISMGRWSGENAGNTVLAEYIKKCKPRYYFCGHIHSGRHELMDIDATMSANVSIMDERYFPSHEPLILEV